MLENRLTFLNTSTLEAKDQASLNQYFDCLKAIVEDSSKRRLQKIKELHAEVDRIRNTECALRCESLITRAYLAAIDAVFYPGSN